MLSASELYFHWIHCSEQCVIHSHLCLLCTELISLTTLHHQWLLQIHSLSLQNTIPPLNRISTCSCFTKSCHTWRQLSLSNRSGTSCSLISSLEILYICLCVYLFIHYSEFKFLFFKLVIQENLKQMSKHPIFLMTLF